eukprot:RCo041412
MTLGFLFRRSAWLLTRKIVKVQDQRDPPDVVFKKKVAGMLRGTRLPVRAVINYATLAKDNVAMQKGLLRALEKDAETKVNDEVPDEADWKIKYDYHEPIAAVMSKAQALTEARNRKLDLIQVYGGTCLIADYESFITNELESQMHRISALDASVAGHAVFNVSVECLMQQLEVISKQIVAAMSRRKGVIVLFTYVPRSWRKRPGSAEPVEGEDLEGVRRRMEQLEKTLRRLVTQDMRELRIPYTMQIAPPIFSKVHGKEALRVSYLPMMAQGKQAAEGKKPKHVRKKEEPA